MSSSRFTITLSSSGQTACGMGEHTGETVVTCGLVVEQRTRHQIAGEPMKFLTLADWTGMVETGLFAQTYKSYGLVTVRYPAESHRDGRTV